MSHLLYSQFCGAFDQAKSSKRLEMALTVAVGDLLRRDSDLDYRARTLTEIEQAFVRGGQLSDLIAYAKSMVQRLLEDRVKLPRAADATANRTYPDFQTVFRAALRRRIGGTLTFFHRRDPLCVREAAPPFLLAPDFSRKLLDAIDRDVVPVLMKSRQMRMIESERDWTQVTERAFWGQLEDRYATVVTLWDQAWDAFRPTRRKTESGVKHVVGPALKQLREELAGDDYAMPRVDDRMISLFAALIDSDRFGARRLDEVWMSLSQVYQQEMDPRGDQDPAREGALRDSLLACFERLDESAGEFLALLCYWNFPRVDLRFLNAFTANQGATREARLQRIPYLMWFLDQPGLDEPNVAENRRRA